MSIYTSYELTIMSSVTRITGIHTIHITGIYPLTNIPPILHTHVPLHCTCGVHIKPTLVHTQLKARQCSYYLSCYCHIYAINNCAPKIPHVPHVLIT